MKNAKLEMKRKGFTLVELLIVIVVIGVLSAMMMLSSTEAVSSAKAADIISDLRNLKTAALAWYADNLASADKLGVANTTEASNTLNTYADKVAKYLNNEVDTAKYNFGGKGEGTWHVWCKVDDTNVKDKLYSRKDSVGLVGNKSANAESGSSYNKETYVGMKIR